MIKKSNKMIMFAVIAVIIVAAPVSFYELVIGYSNPPVTVIQNGYDTNNYIKLTGCAYNKRILIWDNTTVSTLFHQSNTDNSFLNMSLIRCLLCFKSNFCLETSVIINGTLQPGLHPSASVLAVNYSMLHAPNICFCLPLRVTSYPRTKDNMSISFNNYLSQFNKNFLFHYGKTNYTSSTKISFVNVPSFSKGTFHFSMSVGYAADFSNLTKGEWIYTQISFSLLGFSQKISTIIGSYLVGDTD